MKGNKKKKKLPIAYKKIYPFLFAIAVLFMGIGYAKVANVTFGVDGDLMALKQDGIVITKVEAITGHTGNGEIVNTGNTILNTNIILDEQDSSSFSYEVTLYNNIDDSLAYAFEGVTPNGYDENFYPNPYITFELDGLKIGDVLRYQDSITFTITFKYVDGVDFNAADFSNELESYLKFNFKDYAFIADKAGGEEFVVPESGTYLLETWGASGYSYSEDYHGGFGSYSTGKVYLDKGTTLYIHTGGQGVGGNVAGTYEGGYNGGGNGVLDNNSKYTGSGGGASHIALVDGELSTLENNVGDILMVAGGGGAVYYELNYLYLGGHGGGISGTTGVQVKDEAEFDGPSNLLAGGGSQTAGGTAGRNGAAGTFGQGGQTANMSIGAGGGFYGGGSSWAATAGGGSGYIANDRLSDKHMIVYDDNPETIAVDTPPETSNDAETLTYAVTSYSISPIADTAKYGDGYTRISYLEDENEQVSIFGSTYEVIAATPTLTNSSNNTTDESGLYKSYSTNSGKPTYYFRGDVENNYVSIGGILWRIVRVNEDDGSIRLIMNTGINNNANNTFNNNNDNFEKMYYSETEIANDNYTGAKERLDTWYNDNVAAYYDDIVVTSNFCEEAKIRPANFANAGNATLVEFNVNYNPTFACYNDGNGKGIVQAKVGLITVDEAIFAGGYNVANENYFMQNGSMGWTMTPSGINTGNNPDTMEVWRIDGNGAIVSGRVTYSRTYRPVVNIDPTKVTVEKGTGTAGDPFVIS